MHVIVDVIGARYLERNLELLVMRGRLTTSHTVREGRVVRYPESPCAADRVLTDLTPRHRRIEETGRIPRVLEQKVWPLLDQEVARPVIGKSLRLTDAIAHPSASRRPKQLWGSTSADGTEGSTNTA